MSDINFTAKTPLWKQLLGALAGAAAAFVLYQGYAFTADTIAAVTTGGPRAGVLWPSGTWDSPDVSASSAASSVSSTVHVAVSSQSSSARTFLGPFGSLKGLKKFFAWSGKESTSSSVPVIALVASSSSSSVARGLTVSDTGKVWPSATASFPNETIDPNASAPSTPRRVRTVAQAAANAAMNDGVTQPETTSYPTMDQPAETNAAELPAPASVELPQESVSSDLEMPVDAMVTAEPPAQPESEPLPITAQTPFAAPTMADVSVMASSQGTSLPQSGFGIDVVTVMTIGAIMGRKRMARRS